MNYTEFLERKSSIGTKDGFAPIFIPKEAKDFQGAMIEYACEMGRSALFQDCGMGKTLQELAWGQNVVEHTNKNVLNLAPLAVSSQTIREGEKFGIEVRKAGSPFRGIVTTNYEQLHKLDPNDFIGVICDESSILKNFDGKYRRDITEFLKKIPYRLLGTATAAPNDYTELGTSSEALGYLGHIDMLNRFFKNQNNTSDTKGRWRATAMQTRNGAQLHAWEGKHWRFKGHAEIPFWRWICSWSRAMRKPSDLGFSDEGFDLPPYTEREFVVETENLLDGFLFPVDAVTLNEQRDERRRTIKERCEKIAELTDHDKPALVWCHLNEEGELLKQLIPGCVEVSGKDSNELKEEKLLSFTDGGARVLITKPKIGGFGLNFQHCSHVTFFPSHSFEQYYQGVRRCWRYGQKSPVIVDIVTTQGEKGVAKNLRRKALAADRMFSMLVSEMRNALSIERKHEFTKEEIIPSW
jgi:hypothetical protein